MSEVHTQVLHIRGPAGPILFPDLLSDEGVEVRTIDLQEAICMTSIPDGVAMVIVDFMPRAAEFVRAFARFQLSAPSWTPLIVFCDSSHKVEAAMSYGVDDFLISDNPVVMRWRLSVILRQKLRNDKLDGILNSTFDGIVSIDGNGTVLTFNKAAQTMFGLTAGEAIGLNVSVLMDREHGGRHDDYLQRYIKTGQEHIIGRGRELRGRTKGGQIFPLYLQVATLRSGRDWLFVGILKDLSIDAHARTLQYEVAHDPLTGIHNRTYLHATLDAWISRRSADGVQPFALLYIDLDGFKAINDVYSHSAGDAVLKVIGARLRSNVAACDVAARLSGDEFAVLLDGVDNLADAQRIATRLIDQLAQPMDYGDQMLAVSGSVGIALFPNDAPGREGLLHRADLAMYDDKKWRKARDPSV